MFIFNGIQIVSFLKTIDNPLIFPLNISQLAFMYDQSSWSWKSIIQWVEKKPEKTPSEFGTVLENKIGR